MIWNSLLGRIGLKVKVKLLSRVQLFATPWTVAYQAPPPMGDFPGKNIGVGCRFLLQEIFLTQGLNLCPLHWQAGSLPPSHIIDLGSYLVGPQLQLPDIIEDAQLHVNFRKTTTTVSKLLLLLLSCFSRVRLCVIP